ncbi:hypothetical protein BHU11_07055 [Tannerella sp. oral taxon 808]|nr:hypothetical protein BHU11_07055 [Tannerella sp. oral taxon 808]
MYLGLPSTDGDQKHVYLGFLSTDGDQKHVYLGLLSTDGDQKHVYLGLPSTDGDQKHNQPMRVRGNGSECMVFAFEGFSLPDDKQLEVTIHERNGGRTLSFRVQNEDLLRARRIDHLKLQWR